MSTPVSPINIEQQRKLAKDLLRSAREGNPDALARIRSVRDDAATPLRPLRLADAQLAIAREHGFDSWPKLVAHLQERDVKAFGDAVRHGNESEARRLLSARHVRARINDPAFAFGQRAAHLAARNERMLTVLIEAGADVNLKSEWENGPFTVLDNADEATARFLLERGAALTPHVAARLGWFEQLRTLIDAHPELVHARGGDGQQPLHQARTPAIADFLVDRGADIDARCIDHQSTPAQYALVERPDVCRHLIERGATPDIFMAARLGDVALATSLCDADPACVDARINEPGYAPVPPLHIYCWTIGFGVSPQETALKYQHQDLYGLLMQRSPVRIRFIHAAEAGDEATVDAILVAQPSLMPSLKPHEHARLAVAIFHERFAAAELMLRLGFDPSAGGVDGGTALHAACWVGNARLVEQILARGGVPLDARDPTHQSTPLGWTAFGSVHRRARGADYAGVAGRLVAAGADVTAVGNREGRSLMSMAQGNPAMQEVLRHLGAVSQ